MPKKAARKKVRKTAARPMKQAAKKPARIGPAHKPRSRSEVYGTIANHVGISKRDVAAVFDTMGQMIGADLSRSGPGQFSVPGMMRVLVQRKPATKASVRPNPFKPGEMMTVKAKPARNVVKVRALKGLKTLV
jgi:hypothetical protein